MSWTSVPRPCVTDRYPSLVSRLMALRTVVRLTPYSASISDSVGRNVPGLYRPSLISFFRLVYSCL